jgi:hypothetical protein
MSSETGKDVLVYNVGIFIAFSLPFHCLFRSIFVPYQLLDWLTNQSIQVPSHLVGSAELNQLFSAAGGSIVTHA